MAALPVHLLFFASGAAGLIYEVVWVRQFGTVFGSTVYSVALVTALFMCGLGVGGFAAGRFADARFREDPRSPLRWYGRLELAIGALAFALALLLPRLDPLAAWVASYVQDEQGFYSLSFTASLARYAVTALLLAPITLLMGATLTLLIRHVVDREVQSAGWRVSLLYAANTAGAALGCLLTDVALVPALGLLGTQALAAALNAVAGLGALALARAGTAPVRLPAAPLEGAPGGGAALGRAAALTGLALGLIGFASMGMQVVWFRHLVTVLGAHRPVFSMLLFVILTGLWIGSLVGSAIDRRLHRPLLVTAGAVAGFVIASLGALVLFDASQVGTHRAALLDSGPGSRPPGTDLAWSLSAHWTTLRPALWVVGVPICFLGVAFPLANAHVQRLVAEVGRRAGALYLANTAGAVGGSLCAGFALLPALGAQRAALALMGVALAAVAALHAAQRADRSAPARTRRGEAAFAACYALPLVALAAWSMLPANALLDRGLTHLRSLRVLAVREGVNETIAVVEYPNLSRALFTNGHSMSANGIDAQRYMRAFAHVPLLMHERPQRAMVMCFGVGNTLHAALLHPLERADLVDLSRDVLDHADWFAETNGSALRDPRVQVFVNDARQHLRMTPPASYDLITGEPPPIAFAGVVSLYTREFFELARSRLRPGGIVSYWLPIRQVSAGAALSVVRTFVEVFPDSVLLSGAGSELILLGSLGGPPQLDLARIRSRLAALPAVAEDLHRVYLDRPQELVGTFAASADTMRRASARARPLMDDRPTLEYGAALYTRRAGLPPDLFDVGDAERWCPTCFGAAGAAEEGGSESFRVQLDVMARLYANRDFLMARPGEFRRPELAAPAGPAARAEIERSLFLRHLLGLAQGDYRRAMGLLRAGRLEEGTRLLEDIVLLVPGNARVRVTLGEAYLEAGRGEDARQQFARALAIMPDLEPARLGLERARDAPPAG